MTDNNKCTYAYYPIEAFALAMVLFSAGMKMAMIVGIGLILGDVLLHVLHENFKETYKQAISGVAIIIVAAVLYYSFSVAGLTTDIKTVIGFGILSVLLVKHQEDVAEELPDYNRILFTDSIVYGLYVLLAIVREFASKGAIYDVKLAKLGFMSHTFEKTMFALIFAGITLAILNAIMHTECNKNAPLWVCIPTIVLEVPFVWNNVPEIIGYAVGIAFILVVYVTFRSKFALAKISKNFNGIPVELMTLGMMYMIFSIL